MTYNEARFSNLSIPEKVQVTKIIRKEKGARKNGQGFWFPAVSNLCHVQIHYMGRKHDNNGLF